MDISLYVRLGMLLGLAFLFIAMFRKSKGPKLITTKMSIIITKENAKKAIQSAIAHALQNSEKREDFRNQLRILTISLSVTMFGFGYSKGAPSPILLAIFFLCSFMFVMDTFLYDLSDRQGKFNLELNNGLLNFDTANKKGWERTFQKMFEGLDSSDWRRKWKLCFEKGRFDLIWYGLPAVLSLGWFIGTF